MTPAPSLQVLIDTVASDAESTDPLDRLAQASRTVLDLEEVADALLGHYVDQCRRGGHSWSEISAALGVSKQAAHKRFSATSAPAFDRFTPRARAALRGAAEQARALGYGFVDTEHLLLALFDLPEGLAARLLGEAGITRSACEQPVRSRTDKGTPGPRGQLPFTDGMIEVLRGAVEESLLLGHNYIGTEHLLLALFRDPGDPAAETLTALGGSYEHMKARLVHLIDRITQS